jgi:hypothetical protein|tara:strand:- start:1464 stop:1664 length:201 start_codon:yes stop_codon:yes gene_type:complete
MLTKSNLLFNTFMCLIDGNNNSIIREKIKVGIFLKLMGSNKEIENKKMPRRKSGFTILIFKWFAIT